MTELVQKMAPQILAEIKKAKSILLHCHPSPDPDSVGGALAMMQALEAMDKKVTVIKGDSDLISSFTCLPGYEKIVPKNFFEIDLSEFDLFVILDSAAPKMISRLGEVVFPKDLNTIIIDHHISDQKYARLNLVDENYPANCQLLYDLFSAWAVQITPNMAADLFAGIFTDTGGFKYRGVTKETFAVAAKLAELAPNFSQIISTIENSCTLEQLIYESSMLASARSYFDGQVGMASVSFAWFQEHNIAPESIAKNDFVLSRLLSVAEWKIIFSMREEKPNEVKISFRSKDQDSYDVNRIASSLGGGGHKAAAGLFLAMPLEQAKQKVLEAVNSIYPELGK